MKVYQQFFGGINKVFHNIQETQGANIEAAAGLIAEAIVQDGLVHIFGTGHSNVIAEEVFARANTLAPVNQVMDLSLAGSVNTIRSFYTERVEGIGELIYEHIRAQPQDVFIVISNSGRNGVSIDFARSAREHGHKVIVETSVTFSRSQPSRHSSGETPAGLRRRDSANGTPFGDHVVQVEGMKTGLGPASGLAGMLLVHAVLAEAAAQIMERGVEPPVFMAGNLDGGMEYNQALLDRYWSKIRNW